jgi:hypothetical protein
MANDHAKALKDRENGRRGGNPNISATDKAGVNPPDKGEDKAHIPEARSQKPESDVGKRAPRGARLPADWKLADDWKEAAAAKRASHSLPAIDLDLEAELFRNHWHSQGGAKGVKSDWRLAWINWCLSPFAGRGARAGPSQHLSGEQIIANAKW